jgi:hypothetical protein
MTTCEGIQPAAKGSKRQLRDIKYHPLRAQEVTDKHGNFGREVAILQGSFLVLCLMTIIGLILLPTVVLAKEEKNVAFGNDTAVYNNGLLKV